MAFRRGIGGGLGGLAALVEIISGLDAGTVSFRRGIGGGLASGAFG